MPGRLFILVKHKQPSLIFEGATRAYLSGAPNSLVPSNIKLEVDSHHDKCSSLLPRIVNYRKKVLRDCSMRAKVNMPGRLHQEFSDHFFHIFPAAKEETDSPRFVEYNFAGRHLVDRLFC